MILTADFHTHTPYSHGKGTVAENAARAKASGMKGIGISDHGFAHIAFGIREKKKAALARDCKEAERQTGIRVFCGVEANILGESGKTDLSSADYDLFDLFIAGKHVFVRYENFAAWREYFGGNFICKKLRVKPSQKLIDLNTRAYIRTIENNPVDIISHLGYGCPCNALEAAKCAADYGTYIEINTKKNHLTDEEWQTIADKTSVRFLIDSDAHSPDRIGDTKIAEELLSRVSIPLQRIDNIEGRMPTFRFAAYKNGR